MRGVMKATMRVSSGATARICTGFLAIAALILFLSTSSFGADPTNQLVSVAMDAESKSPTVLIQTTEPVGYRYTVYDSYEPVRVVVDFPGMDMADVKENLAVNLGVVQEVRVASFELSSGNLARVEVLLNENTDYQVQLKDNLFRIVFDGRPAVAEAPKIVSTKQEEAQVIAAETATVASPIDEMDANANVLREIVMAPGQAVLSTNGEIDRYKYFALGNPPRLVVDLYGIRPGFKQRNFPAEAGMSQLRIGTYKDKTRLVFDAEDETLPKHSVSKKDADLAVTWGNDVESAAGPVAVTAETSTETVAVVEPPKLASPKTQAAPKMLADKVSVEAIDFENQDGRSYVIITLSSPAEVTSATREGTLVRFDVKNATISRALRRTLDAAAFPTAIDTVDPYIVKAGKTQDVRFAVKLKGAAAYSLEEDGSIVRLVVDDGAFAEAMPLQTDVVEVDAPVGAEKAIATDSENLVLDETALAETGIAQGPSSAQKISLVFDSADVRSILQLIGDVSGMNILASDDVKGSVTLRLIDVPWDQALDLILETTNLGKIRQGNVLRIMPNDKIREMAQTDLQSQKQEIEEAPLVSRVFQISYSSVKDMEAVITDLLTERGNIIADARNKQLIVKDVPSVLDEMGELITQIDKPEKQVLIEARIVEANTTFARDFGVKWGGTYQNDKVGVGTTGVDTASVGLGGSFLITPPSAGSVGSAGAAVGIGFGTVGVDTLTMDLRLSALESSGEGKIVSTPRVTTLNGESATISQGTKIPYTTVSDTGTETSFESAELKLEVTPEINPDGSVILEIKAANSAVGTIVPTGTGNMVSIDEKKAETKVLVRDGETTVIGGIFVETEQDADTGVPVLKDLPLLGHLFKSITKSKERRELLIFITPRILE